MPTKLTAIEFVYVLQLDVDEMNQSTSDRVFIPRKKPKSWIVIIICGLVGVLIAGPLAVFGEVLQVEGFKRVGIFLFWGCWIVAVPMSFIYLYRLATGYYKGISDRDWKDQFW